MWIKFWKLFLGFHILLSDFLDVSRFFFILRIVINRTFHVFSRIIHQRIINKSNFHWLLIIKTLFSMVRLLTILLTIGSSGRFSSVVAVGGPRVLACSAPVPPYTVELQYLPSPEFIFLDIRFFESFFCCCDIRPINLYSSHLWRSRCVSWAIDGVVCVSLHCEFTHQIFSLFKHLQLFAFSLCYYYIKYL